MDKKLSIVYVDIEKIKPHPKNARIHDADNLATIKASLAKHGQRTPIVLGGNVTTRRLILKGCGTWEAARALGWKQIAIVYATGLSMLDEIAYALADNKTSDTSVFDFEQVGDILQDLQVDNYDLSATGFRPFEVSPLLAADWSPPPVEALPSKETPNPAPISHTTQISIPNIHYKRLLGTLENGKKAGFLPETMRLSDFIIRLGERYKTNPEDLKPVNRRVKLVTKGNRKP